MGALPEPGLITVILTVLAIMGVLVNAYVKRDSITPAMKQTELSVPAIPHDVVGKGDVSELIQSQEDRCVERYIRELDTLRASWIKDQERWERMLSDALKTMNQVFANTSERMTTCENTMKILGGDLLRLSQRLDEHLEHHV